MSNIRCFDCGIMNPSKVFTSSSCINCDMNQELPHKKRSDKLKTDSNLSVTEVNSMDIDHDPSTSSVLYPTEDEKTFSYLYKKYGFFIKEKFYIKPHRKHVDESFSKGILFDTNLSTAIFRDGSDPSLQPIVKCDGVHDSCMNTRHKCCICMDKRPLELLYEGYVDGKGIKKLIPRNQHYCPSCKEKTN